MGRLVAGSISKHRNGTQIGACEKARKVGQNAATSVPNGHDLARTKKQQNSTLWSGRMIFDDSTEGQWYPVNGSSVLLSRDGHPCLIVAVCPLSFVHDYPKTSLV